MRGAYVGEVIARQPADEAGIKKGDVVTKVNDEQISSADSLIIALRSYNVGDTVTLTVQRGKNEKKIDVKLGSDADAQRRKARRPTPTAQREPETA